MAVIKLNYSISDLNNEVIQFDKHWKRSFSNGLAIYVATTNNAALTIHRIVKGKLVPTVIQRFKKGRRVIVVGTAVHTPPHTTQVL